MRVSEMLNSVKGKTTRGKFSLIAPMLIASVMLASGSNEVSAKEPISENVQLNKRWVITLNSPIDYSELANGKVYILDGNGNKVDTLNIDLGWNQENITLYNYMGYKPNTNYKLVIDKTLTDYKGKKLGEDYIHSFKTGTGFAKYKYPEEFSWNFQELALFGGTIGKRMILKWNKEDIKVSVKGDYTESDVRATEKAMKEIESATPNLRFNMVEEGEKADLTIYYKPSEELGEYGEHLVGVAGFTRPNFGAGGIDSVAVFVGSEFKSAHRDRILYHEIMHALGFMNHTEAESVLGNYTYEELTFTDNDISMIEFLYSDKIWLGMSEGELSGLLQSLQLSTKE